MEKRQEILLKLVIENYIATAEPVGSRFLLAESGLDCGEATVRNELRALEEAGYLTHPHTSAGRVPTELGYRFYLTKINFNKINISKKDEKFLQSVIENTVGDEKTKNLVKGLSELTGSAVLVAFGRHKIYYTGLSNLFRQPEFRELNLVMDVSTMFDRCEECLEDFYDNVSETPKFYLGNEHPFGNLLSVLSVRKGEDIFAVLGPMRTDYKRNFSLLNKIKEMI